MPAVTRTIAGREITLEPGVRYVAQQLLEDGGVVTISIHRWDPFSLASEPEPAARIEGLSLDEADRFVVEFRAESEERVRTW
jgi:hypothetical protein